MNMTIPAILTDGEFVYDFFEFPSERAFNGAVEEWEKREDHPHDSHWLRVEQELLPMKAQRDALLAACKEAICCLTGYHDWRDAVKDQITYSEDPYHEIAKAVEMCQKKETTP